MRVVVYALKGNGRANFVADAMFAGLRRHNVDVRLRTDFTGVEGDVAVGYGWNHEHVFDAYGQYLYFDMGYWNRKPKGDPRGGNHRLAVNSWCPSDNMLRGFDTKRLNQSGVIVQPSPRGQKIIVAGMSAKAAQTHGYSVGHWENYARVVLTDVSRREIVMRPKVTGRGFDVPIETVLTEAHALVTHHSNCAVDALIAGVPSYSKKGIGRLWSIDDLTKIDDAQPLPYMQRVALLSDVAHAQWTPAEMRTGECWDYAHQILRECQGTRTTGSAGAV